MKAKVEVTFKHDAIANIDDFRDWVHDRLFLTTEEGNTLIITKVEDKDEV